MSRKIDLTGKKFNKLTVLEFITGKKGRRHWKCQCDCSRITIVSGSNLVTGNTTSCGCVQTLRRRENGKKKKTHGHCSGGKFSPEYTTWMSMLQRCLNPKATSYKIYGGSGITVCDRWLKFENFLEDMGERAANKTLDRIDNSLGYYKENCKWSTMIEQRANHGLPYEYTEHCIYN